MLANGQQVFIQVRDGSRERVLNPAKVTAIAGTDDVATIEMEEPDFALEVGQEVFVFFELNRKFSQLPGYVSAVLADEPQTLLGVRTFGQPMPAESRQCYRVSTVTLGMHVILNGKERPTLTDASATGFSFVSSSEFRAGQILDVVFEYDGRKYCGQASVQSLKALENGSTRYGMHCITEKGQGDLQMGMKAVNLSVQRRQLKRLAGTG